MAFLAVVVAAAAGLIVIAFLGYSEYCCCCYCCCYCCWYSHNSYSLVASNLDANVEKECSHAYKEAALAVEHASVVIDSGVS